MVQTLQVEQLSVLKRIENCQIKKNYLDYLDYA